LDERRGERYNNIYNALVDAWLAVLLGDSERNTEIKFSTSEDGTVAETPSFTVGTRTAYSRRLTA
jgi:hypothetical protein